MRGRSNERGAILLIVVGLIAVLTVLVTQALTDTQISVRRATNTEDWNRAFEVARGGAAAAEALLIEDAKGSETQKQDDLSEDWAQVLPPFPVEDGVVAVQIEDGNRYFNVNRIWEAQASGNGTASVTHIDILSRLLQNQGAPGPLALVVADALDPDVEPRPSGDEGAGYTDGGPRNGWFDTDAEIWRLPGLGDPEVQKVLRPLVMAVDPGVNHTINVNTASPQVLAAAIDTSLGIAEQVIHERPFDAVSTMYNLQVLSGLTTPQGVFDVKSDLFRISATARFGRAQATVIRWVRRNGTTIQTIRQEVPLW
ncbi:MAG: hypothetical protein COX57_02720 [Alphaproteobacteria bacterium CG_4_10_14_0_2_um_filter_63_37]|nr:MAG: hypothetical protein AUJ55_10305 [Proteobacteria bacterium CG1_02_64_396]PJA25590.1 MAG: hypothetical protein COX57_02720 [Alphaproteobacteria bacterium CG_4_10_14_0_2_um_filter_63_37]